MCERFKSNSSPRANHKVRLVANYVFGCYPSTRYGRLRVYNKQQIYGVRCVWWSCSCVYQPKWERHLPFSKCCVSHNKQAICRIEEKRHTDYGQKDGVMVVGNTRQQLTNPPSNRPQTFLWLCSLMQIGRARMIYDDEMMVQNRW